jgi:alpha-tubulin suppressor-like RCC1 family protein
VAVINLSGVTSVSAGTHSVAVKSDGTIWSFGSNNHEQLGNGTNANSNISTVVVNLSFVDQVATPTFSPEGGFYLQPQSVTVGCATTGATIHYTTNGSNPTLADPIVAPGSALNVTNTTFLRAKAFLAGYNPSNTKSGVYQIGGYVVAGVNHSLAIKSDGTLWSWGYNDVGQLGIGSTLNQQLPTEVSSLTNVVIAAGGTSHSLAAKADGTVWGWGLNYYGQVGDGTRTHRNTPVQVSGLTNVVAVAAGETHSVALKSDGTVWAWGNNGSGQLGDGTTTQRLTPVQVSGLSGVIAIAAGQYFTLALKSDGTAWGWGNNGSGQLGNGTSTSSSIPVRSGTVYDAVAISAGAGYAVALKADGTVWDWGSNSLGQLGNGSTGNYSLVAVQAIGITNAIAVAASQNHTLAVKSDGAVMAWGHNGQGQLGDGTITGHNTPASVSNLINVTSVSAGGYHSVATARYNAVNVIWAWGLNSLGQLGDETTIERHFPVLTHFDSDFDQDGLPDWKEISLGSDPNNPESNGDGISDGEAFALGISLTDMDIDDDGLTNAQELALGTNLFVADTDGDGVPDAQDAFPLDPTRSQGPPPDPNDHTPPIITITYPTSGITQL